NVRIRSFSGCSNTSDPVSSTVSAGAPASGVTDSVICVLCLTFAAHVNVLERRHTPETGFPARLQLTSAGAIRSSPRLLGELEVARVQLFDLIPDGAHVAVILDHIVRRLETRGPGSLGIQDCTCLVQCRSIPCLQAADLQLLIAIDHQHTIQL